MEHAFFAAQSQPTNFYIALITATTAPTRAINTFSELTEIANGQGYTTGGYSLTRNTTDFDTMTEDDSGNTATIYIKNVVWTASGGTLPASGLGASYAVMLDDNVTIASREVLAYWSLGSAISVSSGQSLTLTDLAIQATQSA
jgi:hypothetical protein